MAIWSTAVRRMLPLLVCGSLALGSWGADAHSIDAGKAFNSQLVQSGYLTVATTGASPPLTYVDSSGNLIGFWPDLASKIAKAMGLRARLVKIAWPGLLPGVAAHQYDLGDGGILETPERLQSKDFFMSKPFLVTGVTVLVLKGSGIKKWQDLKGKAVGGVQGEAEFQSAQTYLSQHGWAPGSIVNFPGRPEGILGLEEHRVDAFALDSDDAVYTASSTTQGKNLTIVKPFINTSAEGTAVSAKEPLVLKAFNKEITKLLKNGTVKKVAKKWFKTTAVVFKTK